jgi:hypothetical protein
MKNRSEGHTFHIPVMGIGFTIDTPLKVAHLGISSVISLVDDILIEKMRKFYCEKIGHPYHAITEKMEDFRARRITEYLNLMHDLVEERFDRMKNSVLEKGNELEKYIEMLPDFSAIKHRLNDLLSRNAPLTEVRAWLHQHLRPGSIDVNIMTKLDRETYDQDQKLPVEFNDAHAALRGFANSKLESSVVLSAGMNPKLYGYIENFDDFYPDAGGNLRKKVILKISDYRSALIQGKFLAKKGIWVSEFRVESGLNCGGHAFATDGYLMGPILEEFKQQRQALIDAIFPLYTQALREKNRNCPAEPPRVKFTAQGGVGTAEEHMFLIDHYDLDSIGWGTPFLLVPEVTNVDDDTQRLLIEAEEKDLYLSGISPLGVPFNTVRGNSKDIEKALFIAKGRPGSSCPKKYVSLNKEFTDKAICLASRQYQAIKIKELDDQQLDPESYKNAFDRIVDKACLCVGLGTSALINNGLDTRVEGRGVSICPGPNMAYFSKVVSLREMVDHIYGRANIIERTDRPHVFVKELGLYVDFLRKKIGEIQAPVSESQAKYLTTFRNNLQQGIDYYRELFQSTAQTLAHLRETVLQELERYEMELLRLEPEFAYS